MLVIYPWYFFELSKFGKILMRDHPGAVESDLGMTGVYKILNRVSNGQFAGTALSSDALAAYRRSRVLLYTGASLFLVFLFIGLTDSVLAGKS